MSKASESGGAVEEILQRGVIEIIPKAEFKEALASGRTLRLKFGLDPSKPDLHIGHGVLLRKLRLFQEMGHQVVLIIGDWTAQIGDPSGHSVTRPMLAAEEVKENAETYMRQFFHVVDRDKTEVRWQSEWFNEFTLADVIRLAARFTVAQILQRDDFRTRFEAQKPLGVHELLYPLLQAYDSVAIDADVEFGGSDQLFNLLVGRELQQEMGQQPQNVFVMDLLVGTDGKQKMAKSLGNTINFEDAPNEQYGKVMSLPDSALVDYLVLATDLPDEEVAAIRMQLEGHTVNPMDVKKRLAHEIVSQFHGDATAEEAAAEFGRVFQKHQTPQEMSEFLLAEISSYAVDDKGRQTQRDSTRRMYDLPHLLHDKGFAGSVGEARRLIKQGAVQVVEGPGKGSVKGASAELGVGSVVRVGKHRFLRIVDADQEESS